MKANRPLEVFPAELTKGDRMRERILRETARFLAREKEPQFPFDAIARPLGVGRAHVAYYFKKKSALMDWTLRWVTAHGQERTRARLERARSDDARIAAFVHGAFDWWEREPDQAAALVYILHRCHVDAGLRATQERLRAAGARRIEATLAEGGITAAGELAGAIQSAITGALVTEVSRGKPASARTRAARARALHAVEALVHAHRVAQRPDARAT